MSLKAKIEAVIYAAEEPVTLAQLASLFADEALEEKRAREAAAQVVVEPANEVSVMLTTESLEPDDGAVPVEAVAEISEEHAAHILEEEAAPLTVEEAMRLLVSGGVIAPDATTVKKAVASTELSVDTANR